MATDRAYNEREIVLLTNHLDFVSSQLVSQDGRSIVADVIDLRSVL